MFPLMPRPRLQLNSSILRALMNCLLMMPLLTTLMVTEWSLLLKAKSKLKERRHVLLIGTRRSKRGMKKPLLFNSSFYCYLFTLCIITFCLYGKTVLFLLLPLFLGVCKHFAFHRLFTYCSLFLHLYTYTNLDILMLSSVSWNGFLSWICLLCWLNLESLLRVPSCT